MLSYSAFSQEDISGCSNDGSGSPKAGMKPHDMIICINGKSVGSMTMPELQIELDLCGPELMLVVSRFEIQVNANSNKGECTTLEDLAMDWNEIGAGCDDARKRKRVSFEEKSTKEHYELRGHTVMNDSKTGESQLVNHNSDEYGKSRDYSQNPVHEPTVIGQGRKSVTLPASTNSARVDIPLGLASLSESTASGFVKYQTDPNDKISYDSSGRSEKSDEGGVSEKKKDKPKAKTTGVDKQGFEKSHTVEKESNHSNGIYTAVKATVKMSTVGTKIKNRYQKQLEELSDDDSDIVPKHTSAKKKKADSSSKKAQSKNSSDSACNSDEDEYEGVEDDENPWLGCVCGKTHPHPIKVFWIQCEGCDAWYNVAQECVGFDAKVAEKLEEWCCWTCDPPVAGLGL